MNSKRMTSIVALLVLLIPVIYIVPIQVANADPTLVGYWDFEEGSGTTAEDQSGNSNDGTINGATYVAGYSGSYALQFDGTNDYVTVPDSASLDITEITIEAWVKISVLKDYNAFIVKGYDGMENCEALSYAIGKLHSPIYFTDTSRLWLNSPDNVLNTGNWHHIAMTYEPGDWRIFIDGYVVARRLDVSKTPQTNDRPLIIGAEESDTDPSGFMSGRFFNGIIDEVKIYNRALSMYEIAQEAGLTVLTPPSDFFGTVIDSYQDPTDPVARTWVWTGYNPSLLSYSWEWTAPNPDPEAGNDLDLRWVNPVGENSYVTWDMGQEVPGVRVYPTQDHLGWDTRYDPPGSVINTDPNNEYDWEYHEYAVYASNDYTDPTSWVGPFTSTAFHIEGWIQEPEAIADDAVKDYDFGGATYRYIKIVPLWDEYKEEADYEIDAVGALGIPPEEIGISGYKFYDVDRDGIFDEDEEGIEGWKIVLLDGEGNYLAEVLTDLGGAYYFEVLEGTYIVKEIFPGGGVYPASCWVNTTKTQQTVEAGDTEINFGNVCLGPGGGKTLGFWSNKNGYNIMNDNPNGVVPELTLLSNLNLVDADGSPFDPLTYSVFRTWLLEANAVNMGYMLSAQLAAMALNVEAGLVDPDALVYAPGVIADETFISIEDLMDAANDALSNGYDRSYLETIKDALDDANNNLNFVQGEPCLPIVYPITIV